MILKGLSALLLCLALTGQGIAMQFMLPNHDVTWTTSGKFCFQSDVALVISYMASAK
jgi:hypothetical protein